MRRESEGRGECQAQVWTRQIGSCCWSSSVTTACAPWGRVNAGVTSSSLLTLPAFLRVLSASAANPSLGRRTTYATRPSEEMARLIMSL